MAQTFIIQVNKEKRSELNGLYDLWRVSCKKKETALRYLKNWKKEADEKGMHYLYRCFFCEGATYEIVATPDGYNETEVVLSGLMSNL